MDWGFVMGVTTAILLAAFLGIVAWAWSHRRRRAFGEAEKIPLLYEEGDG